jgi:hypothetical protein
MFTPAESGTASRPPAGLNAAWPVPFTLCGEPAAGVRAPEEPTAKMYRDSLALTSSRLPLGLNVTDHGSAPRVNGEPGTAVRAPEAPTEKIEIVSPLSFAAARSVPLGLNATA